MTIPCAPTACEPKRAQEVPAQFLTLRVPLITWTRSPEMNLIEGVGVGVGVGVGEGVGVGTGVGVGVGVGLGVGVGVGVGVGTEPRHPIG